jgi:FixJ family two-component response regulator
MSHSILIIDDSAQIRQEIKSVLEGTDMFQEFYESHDVYKPARYCNLRHGYAGF